MSSICCDFHAGAGPGFPSLLSQAGDSEEPALPRPQVDLQETELARTAPATFSIPRPSLDLTPSFAINNFQPRQNPPIPVLRSLIGWTRHFCLLSSRSVAPLHDPCQNKSKRAIV